MHVRPGPRSRAGASQALHTYRAGTGWDIGQRLDGGVEPPGVAGNRRRKGHPSPLGWRRRGAVAAVSQEPAPRTLPANTWCGSASNPKRCRYCWQAPPDSPGEAHHLVRDMAMAVVGSRLVGVGSARPTDGHRWCASILHITLLDRWMRASLRRYVGNGPLDCFVCPMRRRRVESQHAARKCLVGALGQVHFSLPFKSIHQDLPCRKLLLQVAASVTTTRTPPPLRW
jgi:hypothetical protein